MDHNHTSEELTAAIPMNREAIEERRINFERSLFDYWLKAPTWGARDAAILLEMRTSQDHLCGEADDYEVDAMIIGLLQHFQRFGLIGEIGENSDGYLVVPDTKHPPSKWIKCYRDYTEEKPLHFGKVYPFDAKESELPPIPVEKKAAIDPEREEKIARIKKARRRNEKGLFDYWRKMPSWDPYDAVYLLTYRTDPLDAHPDLGHMASLAMLPLADHFRLFGLIDSFVVELDGLHLDGNKRSPSEWIACYLESPDAKPLPFDDPTPAPNDTSASLEKPVATRERNTLLLIIAALCDYSAIRHQERGAARQIARMTEEIGAPVSEDTVLRHLGKIPDAIESREK